MTPRGLCYWVSYLQLSPSTFAAQCKAQGITTVSFLRNFKGKFYCTKFEEYLPALQDAGISWGTWCYPVPTELDLVSELAGEAQALGASHFMVDCEDEWRNVAELVVPNLFSAIRDAYNGPVGYTMYGKVYAVKDSYPWKAFQEARPDFCVPQAYDTDNKQGDDYQTTVVDSWRAYGFRDVQCGLSVVNQNSAEIQAKYSQTPDDVPAVWWWEFSRANTEDQETLSSLQPKPGFMTRPSEPGSASSWKGPLAVGTLLWFASRYR